MKKLLLGKDFKISLGFALLGLLGGLMVVMWQLPAVAKSMPGGISKEAVIAITALQVTVMTFILSYIGIKLSKKVGLSLAIKTSKKDVLLMLLGSGLTSLFLVLTDKLVFAQYLGENIEAAYRFSFLELAASLFYGGVVEEVMLRLFGVSLLVFVLHKLFFRKKSISQIPGWIFMTAIFIAAMAFAAGHLPATQAILGLSAPIIIRCFILNGLGGIVFGYFYWKNGFTMAVASHATVHLFRLLVFMPLFY